MIILLVFSLFFILLVAFDALEDSYNSKVAFKDLGHRYGALFVLLVLVYPAIWLSWNPLVRGPWDIVSVIVGTGVAYIGFRFALFNPIWNKSHGEKLTYLSHDRYTDHLEKMYMPLWTFWITRGFSLAFGVVVLYAIIHIYSRNPVYNSYIIHY